MKYRKDVGEIIRFAKVNNFACVGMTGTGHWKLRHKGGGIVIVPATPSGGRWDKNVRAQIKRIQKEHQ